MPRYSEKFPPRDPRKSLYDFVREFGHRPATEGIRQTADVAILEEGYQKVLQRQKDATGGTLPPDTPVRLPNISVLQHYTEAPMHQLLENINTQYADNPQERARHTNTIQRFRALAKAVGVAGSTRNLPVEVQAHVKHILSGGLEVFDGMIEQLQDKKRYHQECLLTIQNAGEQGVKEMGRQRAEGIASDPEKRMKYEKTLAQQRAVKKMKLEHIGMHSPEEIEAEIANYDPITKPNFVQTVGLWNDSIRHIATHLSIIEKMKSDFQDIIIDKALGKDGPAR